MPISSPRPTVSKRCRAQGLSRLAVAQISPHALGDARPYLDKPEHGSSLVVVGMDGSRGARLSRTNIDTPTLYSVGPQRPRTIMQSCASAAKAPRRGDPFCTTA